MTYSTNLSNKADKLTSQAPMPLPFWTDLLS